MQKACSIVTGRLSDSAGTVSRLSRAGSPVSSWVRAVSAWCLPLVLVVLAIHASPGGAATYQFFWQHPRPQGNSLNGVAFEDAKIGYALGPRGTVISTTDAGSRWRLVTQYPAFSPDLEDLVILGPGQLLAVGTPPGIFISTNGGRNWRPVPNPSTGRLVDVKALGGRVLSTVGDAGQVLRSTDAGATWTLRPSPGSDVRDQFWRDALHGYALCRDRIRQTKDGGQTWHPVPNVTNQGPYNEVFFSDPMHGFILTDFVMYRTTDGGKSWAISATPNGMFYMDASLALSPLHLLVTSNVEGASMFESTDGGASWSLILFAGLGGFKDLDLLSDGTLIATTSNGDIFRSTDAAATWSNRIVGAAPPRNTIGAVNIGPGGSGAAGTSGTPNLQWYRTTDAGRHWKLDRSGPKIPFTDAIEYWDADRAIASGERGKIYRSTDGGRRWTPVDFTSEPPFHQGFVTHVSLPSAGTAFAAVTVEWESFPFHKSILYHTTDYGASWHPRNRGIPLAGTLNSVVMLPNGTGYAAGNDALGAVRMYRTVDHGGHWHAIAPDGLPAGPWDMHWSDPLTGLATITDFPLKPLGIYRTTDGGTHWHNVYRIPARELSFSDAMHGCATHHNWPFNEGAIAVTEDGGITWRKLILPAAGLIEAVTATSDGCLIGGFNGMIMKVKRIEPSSPEEMLTVAGSE